MDDLYDEIEALGVGDLVEIGAEIERANTLYEKLAYLGTAKMPCMECGGSGSLPGGSLGDICPGCLGACVMDHPGAEEIQMPDFAGMRAALSACVDEANEVLPGPHRVPRLSAVRALYEEGKRQSKLLISAAPEAPALPGPNQHDEDYGSLGGASPFPSDSEIAELERKRQSKLLISATPEAPALPGPNQTRSTVEGIREGIRDGLTDYLFELQSVLQELIERCGVCDGDKRIFNLRIEAARHRFLDERRFAP
jgi:hypothetical protein